MQTIAATARRLRHAQRRLTAPAERGIREALIRGRTVAARNGLLDAIRPYTMTHSEDMVELAVETERVIDAGLPGAFVECGTWRGGASFLMAGILDARNAPLDRRVWMFDSYEGLPPVQPIDGKLLGLDYTPDHPWYQDNCAASVEDVRASAERLGVAHRVEIVKGWFDATLSKHADAIGPIALLRLDGDFYESTKTCLEVLYDRVVPGGTVILDDYWAWDGCAVAVHEFLGSRRYSHRLISTARESGPVLIRKPT